MSCFNHSGACDKECETRGCLTLIHCKDSFCPACKNRRELGKRKAEFEEEQIRFFASRNGIDDPKIARKYFYRGFPIAQTVALK